MTNRVVPMIHVEDVRATAAWYETIGFRLQRTHEECGVTNWASLTFGATEVMLNAGGASSTAHRREVDLYVHVDDIDALHSSLRTRIELVEGPHDTEYGMREFTIRDPNRFWITFGQPMARELSH
jgi:hypothetical protein